MHLCFNVNASPMHSPLIKVGDFFDFFFKSKKSDLFDLNQIFFI